MDSMTGTAANSITTDCQDERLSDTVVRAVAAAKDVDPLDLEPLYTVVDPDALNNLFRPTIGSSPTDLELHFTMADCEVVVHGDGEVVVSPTAESDIRPTPATPHSD